MTPSRVLAASFVVLLSLPAPAAGAESASSGTSVRVAADFASRTSLKVSTQTLQFVAGQPGDESIVVVEFTAAARTRTGGDVVLTVESERMPAGPGGAADVEAAVSFSGDGAGTHAGLLRTASASVAGRWQGSGIRSGRLKFALHAPAAGTYTVPVRFVLSTP